MDTLHDATKFRVLLVDDDSDIRAVIRRRLESEGAHLVEAVDGATALAIHASVPVDITILDLGLPDMHGLELLDALRLRDRSMHVIILTGAGAEEDRVRGLLSGADDYVVKPFSVPELVARITSAMRRREPREPIVIEIDGLRIDFASRSVEVDGALVDLTRREFDLLHLLVANPMRVFSRDEILKLAWASSASWQSAATITEHIRRLRLKIESDPRQPRRIVTVRGAGYQLSVDGLRRLAPRGRC
jgi:two-component system, OmpR family, phosphate regulon response regulator PhoB